MAATITITPLRDSRCATKPIRRMFSSRSCLENPRPFVRFWRTQSPSSISTRCPRARSTSATAWPMVVLPEPLKPVTQTVTPAASVFVPVNVPSITYDIRLVGGGLVSGWRAIRSEGPVAQAPTAPANAGRLLATNGVLSKSELRERLVLVADSEVNPKQCARLNHVDRGQDCFHVGGDHGFVVVADDDQRYLAVLSILLVSDTLIGSENGVEGGALTGFEQCPVGKPCP